MFELRSREKVLAHLDDVVCMYRLPPSCLESQSSHWRVASCFQRCAFRIRLARLFTARVGIDVECSREPREKNRQTRTEAKEQERSKAKQLEHPDVMWWRKGKPGWVGLGTVPTWETHPIHYHRPIPEAGVHLERGGILAAALPGPRGRI